MRCRRFAGLVRLGRLAALAAVLAASVAGLSAEAGASCGPATAVGAALADADAVFVGTVTELRFDGRLATFEVEEVWKGEVERVATVTGGPTPSQMETGVHTSVDRIYVEGGRYLVVPYAVYEGFFADNACSATALMTAELAANRPAAARLPLPSPEPPKAETGDGPGWAWLVAGSGGLAALLGVTVAVVRRRSRSNAAAEPSR